MDIEVDLLVVGFPRNPQGERVSRYGEVVRFKILVWPEIDPVELHFHFRLIEMAIGVEHRRFCQHQGSVGQSRPRRGDLRSGCELKATLEFGEVVWQPRSDCLGECLHPTGSLKADRHGNAGIGLPYRFDQLGLQVESTADKRNVCAGQLIERLTAPATDRIDHAAERLASQTLPARKGDQQVVGVRRTR